MDTEKLFKNLGINFNQNGCSVGRKWEGNGIEIKSFSPIDSTLLSKVKTTSVEDYEYIIEKAEEAFFIFVKFLLPREVI